MWNLIFLLVLGASTQPSAVDPNAKSTPRAVLSLSDALQLARDAHPQIRQARAVKYAAVDTAKVERSLLLPQLNGMASYSRSTSNFAQSPGSVPSQVSSYKQTQSLTESVNYFSLGLTLNQLIYDFGYTYNQFNSATAVAQEQEANERTAMAAVLLSVRNAFFNARARKANIDVAHENLANQEKHKTQIDSQVRVGKRPEIDLWQARTDTSNARVQLITANANYQVSLAQLNQSVGREASIDYDVADETLPAVDGENDNTESLVWEALSARPDYIAAERAIDAQTYNENSLFGQYWPSISGQASLTDAGPEVNSTAVNWKVGLNLNWAFWGSGETYYAVRSAEYTRVGLEAARDIVRNQVRLDVESARLGVLGAREALEAAEDARANAEKLLQQAEGRYAAGISSVIELGDAQVAYTTASTQKVTAEYSLASARATLLKALGRI